MMWVKRVTILSLSLLLIVFGILPAVASEFPPGELPRGFTLTVEGGQHTHRAGFTMSRRQATG